MWLALRKISAFIYKEELSSANLLSFVSITRQEFKKEITYSKNKTSIKNCFINQFVFSGKEFTSNLNTLVWHYFSITSHHIWWFVVTQLSVQRNRKLSINCWKWGRNKICLFKTIFNLLSAKLQYTESSVDFAFNYSNVKSIMATLITKVNLLKYLSLE